MFAPLLLGQGKHSLPPPQASAVNCALSLGIQRRLQLILQRGEPPLGLGQLFWKDRKDSFRDRKPQLPLRSLGGTFMELVGVAVDTRVEGVDLGQFLFTRLEELLLKLGIVPLDRILICDCKKR